MPSLSFAEKSAYVDVEYLGQANLIACGVLETDAGLVLVDPGPATSLEGLEKNLKALGATLDEVHALLLTHIHLDHAGATGTIVAQHPEVQVYVHRIGARHMIRPEKLLASAQRIYGDKMDALWGEFLPVPEANVQMLDGGETLRFGGRSLDVAYTPGHAIHHVSYLDHLTGVAFVGDTAGMRVAGVDYVVPVAPPPDIDVERWHESLATLRAWDPAQLFVTHFGPSDNVSAHLDEMAQKLDAWSDEVRQTLRREMEDSERMQLFHTEKMRIMRNQLSGKDLAPYERFGQPEASWHGLARYWRKKEKAED